MMIRDLRLQLFSLILIWSFCDCVALNIDLDFSYKLDEGYPIIDKSKAGGISGIDVFENGSVIIFSRGNHAWDPSTFDGRYYMGNRDSPIETDTIMTLDSRSQPIQIITSWGRNLFFMPHGLSLDPEERNIWITDVALHQVFKFSLSSRQVVLELGTRFEPGDDDEHFCKPTSVADTGDFVFVADGYCNSRIIMFSAKGRYLSHFGQSSNDNLSVQPNQPTFNVPHKITYARDAKILGVADRENGLIQLFNFDPNKVEHQGKSGYGLSLNGAIESKMIIDNEELRKGLVYSIDYSPVRGGMLIALSGPNFNNNPTHLYVFNVTTGQLISRFEPPPKGDGFGLVHDIAIAGDNAQSVYVVETGRLHLWRFSRPYKEQIHMRSIEITRATHDGANNALSVIHSNDSNSNVFRLLVLISAVGSVLFMVMKTRKFIRREAVYPFSSLYSNTYPSSVNSLFGGGRLNRRVNSVTRRSNNPIIRRALMGLFDRNTHQNNDFSRIPLEDSDNSDDKSDSDVEEFNINQAVPSVKINV